MAYGNWRTAQALRARIEIVPLMDVMFLLLSFFIYVTMRMVMHGGIPVDLAAAKSAEPVTRDQRLAYLSVAADGRAFLDEQPMTDDELATALHQLKTRAVPVTVVLNADRAVTHARVVQVLDLARQADVGQVVFAVESPAKASP